MWNEYGMPMGNGLWHWFTDFHGIVSLIFLVFIVIGTFLLIRDLRREGSNKSAGKTPSAKRKDFESGVTGRR